MKPTGTVFLLCIWLSSAKAQLIREDGGRGNMETENQGNPAVSSTDSKQACQPDVHAVLRELTALIAEQKVEMKHTQSALQAVADRLKASEDQVEDLKKENAGMKC